MLIIAFVALSVLVLDQLTKWLALEFLAAEGSIAVIPNVFHLSFVENTGIAFGFFQGHPAFFTHVITVSVVVLLIASRWFVLQPRSRQIAFGLILGGAVGNWIDRLRYEHVIDFIDFRIWPVFNIADSGITVGVLMFVWFMLKR